jgi:hypothetical protein
MLSSISWIVVDIVLILFSITMIRLYLAEKRIPQKINKEEKE